MARALTEIRQTLWLGIPMAGAQLSQLAMTTTDVAFVGRLGTGEALAAMAVGQASYGLFLAFGIGLIAAVNPLSSQAFGAGRLPAACRPMGVGIWCALVYGVLSWLVLWNIDHFYAALAYDPDVARQATLYVRCIMLGLPAYFVFLATKNYLDSISRPRLSFLVAFLAVAVNAVVAYALVFGRWGVPAYGVVGVGLATATVNVVMAVSLLGLTWRELAPGFLKPRIEEVTEFLTIGFPIALSLVMEVGLFVCAALLMGKLGTDEAAAHQIVITCASSTFMVPLGISFAGATRVGQAIGAGEYERVRAAGLAAIAVGACCMLVSGALFTTQADTLVALFWSPEADHGAQVRAFAIDMLFIAGVFQIFDGIQVTSSGALRGMKDVKAPLLIAFFSYWVLGLGTATYLAFQTPLRHRGVWLGLAAGLGCAAACLLVRFVLLSRRLQADPVLRQAVRAETLGGGRVETVKKDAGSL